MKFAPFFASVLLGVLTQLAAPATAPATISTPDMAIVSGEVLAQFLSPTIDRHLKAPQLPVQCGVLRVHNSGSMEPIHTMYDHVGYCYFTQHSIDTWDWEVWPLCTCHFYATRQPCNGPRLDITNPHPFGGPKIKGVAPIRWWVCTYYPGGTRM